MFKETSGWPIRESDGAFVNPDSPEVIKFLESGGSLTPADPIPVIRKGSSIEERLTALEKAVGAIVEIK